MVLPIVLMTQKRLDPLNMKVGFFYVASVNEEVSRYYDSCLVTIQNALDSMPISEHYKRRIGSRIRMVNYHEKAVVILKVTCNNGGEAFDNAYTL